MQFDVQQESAASAAPLSGTTPGTARAALVLKYGGSVQEDTVLGRAWASDVAMLVRQGVALVVVHGGGPELSRWMQRLGSEPDFVDGHRVTNAETAALAEMVFARINKQIVGLLAAAGVPAIGISGSDGGLLRVRPHRPGGRDLGYVGAVESVDPEPLHHLQRGGYVPVVAPTAADAAGQTYNINADLVAAAIAAALGVRDLLFLSDVPGYMEGAECVPVLTRARVQSLLDTGRVQGGMQPKLQATLHALAAGVERVLLLDGRSPHIVLAALSGVTPPGTRVVDDAAVVAAGAGALVDDTVQAAAAAGGNTGVAARLDSGPAWAGTLAARGEAVLMDTYTREPLELVAGNGCTVVDSAGRRYLDFGAGIAVSALGHAHPAVTAALRAHAGGLVHTSNLYWTEPMVRLAERLVAVTGMERAFFCNSGTEAVEAALKLARKARPGRSRVVVCTGGFHGRTLGALSATMQESYQAPFRPLVPGFVAVPFGDADAASAAIDADTAAVLVEPIQGEGGVRPAPTGF